MSDNEKTEILCGYGECASSYRSVASLKVHQRKKHAQDYAITGLKMRQGKRRRIDEDAAAIVEPPAAIVEPPVVITEPTAQEIFELALANTRKDLDQQIDQLSESFAQQRKQLHDEISSLVAEMISQKQQLKSLAKKGMKWCVVCFEKEVEYAFDPCGHKCVCLRCAEQTQQRYRKCPCCRRDINKIIRIFDVSAWESSH